MATKTKRYVPDRVYDYNKVLRWIVEFKIEYKGASPTLVEIMEGCEVSSKSVVSYIIDALEQEGSLTRRKFNRNFLHLSGESYSPPPWYEKE